MWMDLIASNEDKSVYLGDPNFPHCPSQILALLFQAERTVCSLVSTVFMRPCKMDLFLGLAF
jgi:hypothetical protein